MAIDDYNEAIANHQAKSIDLPEVAEGNEPAAASVGYDWFAALTGMKIQLLLLVLCIMVNQVNS